MGGQVSKPSNKSMVDRLVDQPSYIRTPSVEGVFRAVDRAMYFDLEEGEAIDPYGDDPWRRGNLHLSAPCIYAKVVEALELRPGLSFLNLGSGTGYLNTIMGLLVGPNGVNHGIEFHSDVVEYAYKRLEQFKQQSNALDKYEFSEPIFVKGNCLNLNPDSKYDRIYLGAACLPDLEDFMKKLVKPNGGILVMPYENHLMRYVRLTETEWRNEKLMDVNFTLMIRQDDNQTIIDMPLAQVKSLKELCRITIRQQLRDKTNFMNPSLLHSDNIHSRRMRKAKAERQLLLREERRVKAECLHQLPRGTNSFAREECRPPGSCICKRLISSIENDDSTEPSPSRVAQLKPSTSTPGGRVQTRSASRRLVRRGDASSSADTKASSSSAVKPKTREEPEPSPKGGGSNQNNANHVESSDSDNDDNNKKSIINNKNKCKKTTNRAELQDCARSRPYVHPERKDKPLALRESRRQMTAVDRRVQIAFQAQLARATEHISSTSSESESSSEGAQNVEEYDYIRHQVVLNWPGFLRIHQNEPDLDLQGPPSISGSSISNLTDLILGTDSSEESGWDNILDEMNDNHSDDEGSSESVHFQVRPRLSDEKELEEDVDEGELLETNSILASSSSTTQPCKSCDENFHNVDSRGNSSFQDLEPVARRLRSKRGPVDSESATEKAEPKDRPVPSCSRDEACDERHKNDCSHQFRLHCHHRHHCHHHHHHHHHHKHRKTRPAGQQPLQGGSSSSNNQTGTDSAHSSARLSESSSNNSMLGQEMFSGRVLITTGLGTTLSFARHYVPAAIRGSSFRLLERRSLSSMGPNRNHCQLQQQLERKRKRHSSSESSEASNNSSPSRRGRSGTSYMRRRHCACYRSSTSMTAQNSEASTLQVAETSCGSSKVMATNTAIQVELNSVPAREAIAATSWSPLYAQRQRPTSPPRLSGPSPSSRLRLLESDHLPAFLDREHSARVDNTESDIATTNNVTNTSSSGRPGTSRQHQAPDAGASRRRGYYDLEPSRRNMARLDSGVVEEPERHVRNRSKSQRKRRGENECDRYHNHMNRYIHQLPLPRVLHDYLNYNRAI